VECLFLVFSITKKHFMKTDPGLLKKAANFTKAVVKHAADGLERLPEEQYLERLTVCESCETYNVEKGVCRDWRCGCSLKKKAWWRSEECPKGKWKVDL
jgi:hypothetical protein